MTLSQAQFDAFEAYVNETDAHRERECQPYLFHAAPYLLRGTPIRVVGLEEERNFFGRTDVIIGAEIRDDTNQKSKRAYIWELKSPQSYLFEMDTQNRCRPTDAFFQGENQLLHYFYEAAGNERFRERMGIISQDDIHIGGLVIGTSARMLRGSTEVQKAETALKVRKNYLYRSYQMRIITWDSILDFVRPV